MELTAEQAEGIGMFDPSIPEFSLYAFRERVREKMQNEWNAYLAAPLDSLDEARLWGGFDALEQVLAMLDGEA